MGRAETYQAGSQQLHAGYTLRKPARESTGACASALKHRPQNVMQSGTSRHATTKRPWHDQSCREERVSRRHRSSGSFSTSGPLCLFPSSPSCPALQVWASATSSPAYGSGPALSICTGLTQSLGVLATVTGLPRTMPGGSGRHPQITGTACRWKRW